MRQNRGGLAVALAIAMAAIALVVLGLALLVEAHEVFVNRVQAANRTHRAAMSTAHDDADREVSKATRRKLCAERKNPGATEDACRTN